MFRLQAHFPIWGFVRQVVRNQFAHSENIHRYAHPQSSRGLYTVELKTIGCFLHQGLEKVKRWRRYFDIFHVDHLQHVATPMTGPPIARLSISALNVT